MANERRKFSAEQKVRILRLHLTAKHILLTLQVILGYVLMGALVIRFAVLFTVGGPAGEFADEKGEEEKEK